MKRAVVLVVLLCSALFAVAQANYQYVMRATIPFDFQMDERVMPAGEHQFRFDIGARTLVLVPAESGESMRYVRIGEFDDLYRSEQATIGFVRYGEQYFLRDFKYPTVGKAVAVRSATELRYKKLAQQKVDIKADEVGK